jgi:branched-chain amino acid transport system permease protein
MLIQLLTNGVIAGSIYALIALGFIVIYKTVRFFNFAHGVVYAVGAYCFYTLAVSLSINPIAAFFLPQSWRQSSVLPLID